MKYPNKFSYGQLFAFSGLDGECLQSGDFVGVLQNTPIHIRFHLAEWVELSLSVLDSIPFNMVTGDVIESFDGSVKIVFISKNSVAGYSSVLPTVQTENGAEIATKEYNLNDKKIKETVVTTDAGDVTVLRTWRSAHGYSFAFSFGIQDAQIYTEEEIEKIVCARKAYYENKPKCKEEGYERLYYKCLSVNKVNVYTAEGKIPCRWTTPDRVPHKFMWLWDSAFHAMSFMQYDVEMAKDALWAILSQQDDNGFIAHMYTPEGRCSNVTQPQVLAWAVWCFYEKTKDKAFIERCLPILKKYLLWSIKSRDINQNDLLEWLTNFENVNCRCDESGLDNSPRFDTPYVLDAVDFSTYLANDAKYVAKICEAIGDKNGYMQFQALHEKVKSKINELLWDEQDGMYYDRTFNGELTGVKTPFSFLPMFAGLASEEQAKRMVQNLTNEEMFWSEMPVPSISKQHPLYSNDMWRGCSWLNIDYFLILGLRRYGYFKEAEEMRRRVLNSVNKWYEETGTVFEFYDADNKVSPFKLLRKGKALDVPNYREHVHSISDYNWTACFIMLLINEIYLL